MKVPHPRYVLTFTYRDIPIPHAILLYWFNGRGEGIASLEISFLLGACCCVAINLVFHNCDSGDRIVRVVIVYDESFKAGIVRVVTVYMMSLIKAKQGRINFSTVYCVLVYTGVFG